MSFILDALKKSESDRQRQSGPALFEVKVAPPRTHLPAWAIAIAALLVVNLGIVMWLLMRHPTRTGATDAASITAAAPTAGSPAVGGAAGTPAVAGGAQGAQGAAPPTALARASAAAPALSTAAMPASGGSEPPDAQGATAPSLPSAPGAGGAGAASSAGGGAPAMGGSNPDDYAPAEEAPASAPGGAFNGRVRRGTASGVPLYQDAAATPGTQIPQLRLDLHVFAMRPQDRFVMINMHKLHEGDTTPEGVHVENITPEGAVLSFNGSRFLLPRE